MGCLKLPTSYRQNAPVLVPSLQAVPGSPSDSRDSCNNYKHIHDVALLHVGLQSPALESPGDEWGEGLGSSQQCRVNIEPNVEAHDMLGVTLGTL